MIGKSVKSLQEMTVWWKKVSYHFTRESYEVYMKNKLTVIHSLNLT